MELSEKDIEQLEAFWEGRLSAEEEELMNLRLASDPDFRRKAHMLEAAIKGLEQLREKEVRDRLRKLDSEFPLSIAAPPKIRITWYAVAAGIVVVVVIVLLCAGWPSRAKRDPSQMTPKALFQMFFQPYPYLGQTMDEADPAAAAYKDNLSPSAIPFLIRKFEAENDTLSLFYLGIVYLGNQQTEQAVSTFKRIEKSNSLPRNEARWYLALAYLKSGNKQQALPLLQSLAETTWKNQQKARELLEKVRKL